MLSGANIHARQINKDMVDIGSVDPFLDGESRVPGFPSLLRGANMGRWEKCEKNISVIKSIFPLDGSVSQRAQSRYLNAIFKNIFSVYSNLCILIHV